MARPKRQTPKEIEDLKLVDAIQHELTIKEQAAEIRGEAQVLDVNLFLKLYPLLTRDIPEGFIQHVPKLEKGKPYPSTGIRSVQVQIDRMNNVLTPLWWSDSVEYFNEGKLAKVTVEVRITTSLDGALSKVSGYLVSRTAYGGVNQGSSVGNVYKGSYTNAAKVAFARLGVGHEVYLGVADLDPDTSIDAAKQQGEPDIQQLPSTPGNLLNGRAVADMIDLYEKTAPKNKEEQVKFNERLKLYLGSIGVVASATFNATLANMTPAQARELDFWFNAELDKQEDDRS